ncbi:hypothetical protein B0A50_01552 [Salinomyces thailandicus]|uniref:Glycosyl transferase CAP10 domain-containing protein n=1 Tax=Salinomyces thailandicus TaxID=706561 RepID=A0A4U0UB48_9PEZI|nr:hypothetical protein B0A50_01552 [Salinomyces thailandica]
MHPAFWKGLSAVLLLCLLIQQYPSSSWWAKHHGRQLASTQELLDYNDTAPTEPPKWDFDWQRDGNNHSLSAAQCDEAFPRLYHEIDRSMAYWRERDLNTQSLELYEGNEAGLRVLVRDGQLRVLQTKGMYRDDFRQRVTAVLHQVYRAITAAEGTDAGFHNTELTFIVDDWPNFPQDGRDLAALSFTRNISNRDHDRAWLMPEFNFWAAVPSAGAFADMQAKARQYDLAIAEKVQKAVWRGVEWTNQEVRGALLAQSADQSWADVRKMTWSNTTDFLPLHELCRYAYVVNTEGRSWSSRLTHLLNCDSVPIIHDITWTAHYYHLLHPVVNYISVHRNFSDLGHQIEYYKEHRESRQRIADAARTMFRERYTTPAAAACYWRRLLRSWSSVAAIAPREAQGIAFEEFV